MSVLNVPVSKIQYSPLLYTFPIIQKKKEKF